MASLKKFLTINLVWPLGYANNDAVNVLLQLNYLL